MPSKKNQEMLEKFNSTLNEYKDFFVTENQGLNVADLTQLRKQLEEQGASYCIVKNNVFRIALEGKNIKELDSYLIGSNGVLFTKDPIKSAKTIDTFAKANKNKIFIKAGYTEGQFVDENYIKELASLSSKEDLIAKLLYILKSPLQRLTMVLDAVAKKKEEN